MQPGKKGSFEVPQTGFFKKSGFDHHLQTCQNPACGTSTTLKPGLLFLGLCLAQECAMSGAQTWHLAQETKGRCPKSSQSGPWSGRPDRRTFYLNTAPESAVQANRLVCSPTKGFFFFIKIRDLATTFRLVKNPFVGLQTSLFSWVVLSGAVFR